MSLAVRGRCQTGVLEAVPLQSPRQWALLEFSVNGVPGASNPFDPGVIAVDGLLAGPSGRQWSVPAFWYQNYDRRLTGGRETLQAAGTPGWRLRFTPSEPGRHTLVLTVRTNAQAAGSVTTEFTVDPFNPSTARPGFVRAASNGRYLETDQGEALPLLGHCVCWHGDRGTRDYDVWFNGMQEAGENYTRLWMAPWAFGIETDPGTLGRYRLDRAWQLDYVLQLAERRGIYVMLCLDYHGMFEVEPDYWGGNNFWPKNPYNASQGGPCANQDAFFTSAQAMTAYRQRLRYLIARYGYSQNLLAWEFFNEIDNVSRYLDASHVAAWHAEQGRWLKANDPFRHLITTSLSGADRPELWRLPEMEIVMHHTYGVPQPAATVSAVAQTLAQRYGKPVMVGEFGTDWRGWRREQDPYLRGWRQGLWAGVMGGSVGTSMSWFWENIQSENLYPTYAALKTILAPTAWGSGRWTPLTFQTSGDPPATVADPVAGGTPFGAQLLLSAQWAARLDGQLALAMPLSATWSSSHLNAFVHGTGHPELRLPFQIDAWFGAGAQLTLHVNSVSDGARLAVFRDNVKIYEKSLPNLDGGYQVNDEYNTNLVVALPSGHHRIEVRNTGGDWFYLDWIRFENVLPAQYPGGWQPSPVAAGLRGDSENLLYVVSPQVSFPANALETTVELTRGAAVVITNLPPGRYQAGWYNPATGAAVGETTATNQSARLVLPLPDFREDLAGRVRRVQDFSLRAPRSSPSGPFEAEIVGDPGRVYAVEVSPSLAEWRWRLTVTNHGGLARFADELAGEARGFYRLRLLP